MGRYQWFLISFIVSVVAAAVVIGLYLYNIINLLKETQAGTQVDNPFFFFSNIFSPLLIFSLIVLIVSSIGYRVIGIVTLANNQKIESTDRILWILGFVFFGFITAIVFLVLNKSKNFFDDAPVISRQDTRQY